MFYTDSNFFKIAKSYIHFFIKLRRTNGLLYAIGYFKLVRLHITRFICGNPLKVNTDYIGLDKDGFPNKFPLLKLYIVNNRFDNNKMRAIMTLLCFTRSIDPTPQELEKVPVKFDTIFNPYKGVNYTIPMWFIKEFVNHYGFKGNYHFSFSKTAYFSLKSSPFGNAIVSSFNCILGIPHHIYRSLYNLSKLSNQDIWLTRLYNLSWEQSPKSRGLFKSKACGSLSLIKDPELKMRVIAMLDYYSQLFLKPIHNHLFKCLKELPCDRTFTQDPAFENRINGNHRLWSLDLSAATDRFPIKLQEKLIRAIFGYDVSSNWVNILTNRDFTYKGATDIHNTNYRYSVGQPMGAYSSWAAFTLSHHLCVHWCAHLEGYSIGTFKNYILLGDDIVINHNGVSKRYIILMRKLGVDISMAKTHVSNRTYEFAKRWISNGNEITGIPMGGVVRNYNSPKSVLTIFYDYITRLNIGVSAIETVSLFYDGMVTKGKRNKGQKMTFKSTHKYLYHYNMAIRFRLNLITLDEFRAYIASLNCRIALNCDIILLMKVSLLGSCGEVLNKSLSKIIKSNFEYIRFRKLISNEGSQRRPNFLDFSFFPMFHSLLNQTRPIIERIYSLNSMQEISNREYLDTFIDSCLPDLDPLFKNNRNVKQMSGTLDKLWKRALNHIRFSSDIELKGSWSKFLYGLQKGAILDINEELVLVNFTHQLFTGHYDKPFILNLYDPWKQDLSDLYKVDFNKLMETDPPVYKF